MSRAPALAASLLAACSSARVDGAERILDTAWSGAEGEARRAAPPPEPIEGVPVDEPASEVRSEWTLEAILDRIALVNPTLGSALARLDEAEAARKEAVAAYFPELSLGLDYLSTDEPARAFAVLLNQQKLSLGPGFDPAPGSVENWREEVRLDWPLFAPGRGESRRAAEAGAEAARLTRESIERRLLNSGVQEWLGLRAARELEGVARESIAVVESRLEQTRRREREGAALRADVLRLEVRLAAARQEAAHAALVVRMAESSLNQLMGQPPDAPLALAAQEIVVGASLPGELDALFAAAEAGRRDLAAAAHGVRMHGFRREASKAERLPSLGAFAAYDVNGADLAIDTDLAYYVVGVGLHLPFSARTGAKVRQAAALERRAREELRELALSVAREVRDAFEALAAARESLGFAEASVDAAREAFRILAEAQDAGGATVTDVLESEDARKKASVRLVAAQAGVQIALTRLVGATGGVR